MFLCARRYLSRSEDTSKSGNAATLGDRRCRNAGVPLQSGPRGFGETFPDRAAHEPNCLVLVTQHSPVPRVKGLGWYLSSRPTKRAQITSSNLKLAASHSAYGTKPTSFLKTTEEEGRRMRSLHASSASLHYYGGNGFANAHNHINVQDISSGTTTVLRRGVPLYTHSCAKT